LYKWAPADISFAVKSTNWTAVPAREIAVMGSIA